MRGRKLKPVSLRAGDPVWDITRELSQFERFREVALMIGTSFGYQGIELLVFGGPLGSGTIAIGDPDFEGSSAARLASLVKSFKRDRAKPFEWPLDYSHAADLARLVIEADAVLLFALVPLRSASGTLTGEAETRVGLSLPGGDAQRFGILLERIHRRRVALLENIGPL